MSAEFSTPDHLWIITEEVEETPETPTKSRVGARGAINIDGSTVVPRRHSVQVSAVQTEMKEFIEAMRLCLDAVDKPDSKTHLHEVEVSVEINKEGQLSICGAGAKLGGKSSLTFKFKRQP
jgi:hypothetical protein